MADINRSIGTTGRDYSTITLWEAAIPADMVTAAERWIGTCYADSDFNETVSIGGHTTNSSYYPLLTVAAGERHTGPKPSTGGVVINRGGADLGNTPALLIADHYCQVEWIRIYDFKSRYGIQLLHPSDYGIITGIIKNCIIQKMRRASGVEYLYGIYAWGDSDNKTYFRNPCVYDVDTTDGFTQVQGIYIRGGSVVQNVVVVNFVVDSGNFQGIEGNDSANEVYNSISMNHNITATDNGDFYGTFNANSDYNMSQDASAPGGNSQLSKTPANQFVSLTSGSEDLHIKDENADSVKNALKQTDFNYDIDGDTRGGIWDIGPDQITKVGIPLHLLTNSANSKGVI